MPRTLRKSAGRELKPKTPKQDFESLKRDYEQNTLHHTRRWQKLRDAHIGANPFCWFCGKIAEQVHHVDKDKDLFYDSDNLASICTGCHEKLELLQIRKSNLITMLKDEGIEVNTWAFMEKIRDAFNDRYNHERMEANNG